MLQKENFQICSNPGLHIIAKIMNEDKWETWQFYMQENDGCKTHEHTIVPKTLMEKEIVHIMHSMRWIGWKWVKA